MQLKLIGSLTLASAALLTLVGSTFAAELAKPMTASERHYAQRNIAQDADSGVLPPSENALVPEADTADAVPNPARTLQALQVKSRDGDAVGRIQKIQLASNGHARALDVAVGGRLITLKADQVVYDPRAQVAVAPYSTNAMLAMAGGGEGLTASAESRIY